MGEKPKARDNFNNGENAKKNTLNVLTGASEFLAL